MKIKLTPEEVTEAIKTHVRTLGFRPKADTYNGNTHMNHSSVEFHIGCSWGAKLESVEVDVYDPELGQAGYRSLPEAK